MQQLKLKQRHEPRNQQEAIRGEYEKHAKSRPLKRPLGFESASRPAFDPAAASTVTEPTNLNRFNKRRLVCWLSALLHNSMIGTHASRVSQRQTARQ